MVKRDIGGQGVRKPRLTQRLGAEGVTASVLDVKKGEGIFKSA